MERYIIGIDQSTQGTKVALVDSNRKIVCLVSKEHRQLINEQGWISHDLNEIYSNIIELMKELLTKTQVNYDSIVGIALTNQRETACAWSKNNGESLTEAIVWQCSRAKYLCDEIKQKGDSEIIKQKTGMALSPYFSAVKFSWMLKNIDRVRQAEEKNDLCLGTIDSWLLFKLTYGEAFKTELSNASRTQLLNIDKLEWDKEICSIFQISPKVLPEIVDSDALFGYTDFDDLLSKKVPIYSVLGDSQAALFGQECLNPGEAKATYGTGSSIMMNIGGQPIRSKHNLVTSIAWKIKNKVNYVLEGNINYAGAVIKWLIEDIKLIHSAAETEKWVNLASPSNQTYLVPAFTGLGAPYWNEKASATLVGMTRTTGKAEIVQAALNCIAYQINDIVQLMIEDFGHKPVVLKVDGGASCNHYLMQFQSDISNIKIAVPNIKELSLYGTVLNAGIASGIYREELYPDTISYSKFIPNIENDDRIKKISGWRRAITFTDQYYKDSFN